MKDKKEQVALYGLGNVGRSMAPYLKERYEIAYWVDGNERLWGTEYAGISVRSPKSILEYTGRIIITTTDTYFVEISESLLCSGIEKNRIFRGQHHVYDQREEIVPYEFEMLEPEQVDLKNCDLLKRDEAENGRKVMVFCGFYSSYVNQLVRNCKRRFPDIHFGILSNSETYLTEMGDYADHIYVYHSYAELYGILKELPKYDAFQMLWIENIWVYFRKLIREKCGRLNLCVGGSDLYRARDAELVYKKALIDMADRISAETDETIAAFVKAYPSAAEKMRWVNFGIETLEYVNQDCLVKAWEKKKSLGISGDRTVILCGYNAGKAHQHLEMIHALDRLDASVKGRMVLVFPMTYPDNQEDYIACVKRELEKCGIDYRILTEYMNLQVMAEIEMMSDVLITVQKTDQLSSTMLETMYAGKVIIAGSWLPYGNLREKGLFFLSVDTIDGLAGAVSEVMADYKAYRGHCSENKSIVYALSSWNATADRWRGLWED